ncbi:S26 family signal peptidase [Synergistaceae bacterium OttesenSCG-928-I11]|nr:S26 family signal peptidase [Synergistaceae bacterium OttesenSCG-928-I11]
MNRKITVFCALLVTLLTVAVALFLLFRGGYRVNRSASLPGYIYKLTPITLDEPLKHGDCVAIDLKKFHNPVIAQGAERGYVNFREPMLKRIGALPGEFVALGKDVLIVNDEFIPLTIASADSNGGTLTAWPTPLVLSADCYWLVSDPIRGFDSRYFGPVSRFAFTHKAIVIF